MRPFLLPQRGAEPELEEERPAFAATVEEPRKDPSTASSGCLSPRYVELLGLTMKPNTWFGGRFAHQGVGVFFILKGARDTRNDNLGLFRKGAVTTYRLDRWEGTRTLFGSALQGNWGPSHRGACVATYRNY